MADGTSYSAGNLEFVVQEISDKTISKLDLLQGKLQTMLNTLSKVSSLTKDLGTTVGRASGRSSGSKAGGGASSDYTKVSKRLVAGKTKVYAQAITVTRKVGNETTKLTRYYNEQDQEIQKLNKNLDENAKKSKSSQMSALSLARLFNKIYFLRNYTKQMFASIKSILDNAVDYTETLNLWQVAMRGNTREAENFVKTMNKAYGIATQTLMEYQAIFKNMLSSLGGLTSDTSYALSEYLTQMAIDYASLYNVSIERAMTTFQSVLSGQVRPIRSIAGYDITETTIYQLYQQLGGTKTMRQLSQTEKRLLRIYAVFQQMESSGAIGDLGKTMESTANQIRMLTEQTKEFGTWIGLIFESWLRPWLPKLNAFMITLTNITKAYAKLNNIKPQEFGAVESMEQLSEAMDEVQGKLLSFDRFEALNSGSDNNMFGIDESLLAGLSKYSGILSNVTGEAQSLAEQWTKLFVDSETGEFTALTDKIMNLSKALGGILVIITAIKKPLLTIITLLAGMYITDKEFRKSIDDFMIELSNLVVDLLPIIVDLIKQVLPIATQLIKDVMPPLVALLKELLPIVVTRVKILAPVLVAILKDIEIRVKFIGIIFTSIYEMILAIPQAFSFAWKAISNTFASIINRISNSFISFVNMLIDKINILLEPINAVIRAFGGEGLHINSWEAKVQWKPYEDVAQLDLGARDFNVPNFRQANSVSGVSKFMGNNNNGVGDVYLDGKKVGVATSKYSYNENVRTGRVLATI